MPPFEARNLEGFVVFTPGRKKELSRCFPYSKKGERPGHRCDWKPCFFTDLLWNLPGMLPRDRGGAPALSPEAVGEPELRSPPAPAAARWPWAETQPEGRQGPEPQGGRLRGRGLPPITSPDLPAPRVSHLESCNPANPGVTCPGTTYCNLRDA